MKLVEWIVALYIVHELVLVQATYMKGASRGKIVPLKSIFWAAAVLFAVYSLFDSYTWLIRTQYLELLG